MATKAKKSPTGAAAVRSAAKIIKGVPAKTEKWTEADVQKWIRERAYFYFLERGCAHGHDREDWERAEKESRKWR